MRNKIIGKIGKLDLWFIKNKKRIAKFARRLMIFVVPLLLLAVVLIGYEIFTGEMDGVIRKILTILILVAILYFVYIIITLLTRYKKEFELNDEERKARWKYLSRDYKRFWNNMQIFGLIFFFLLAGFGLSEVFLYKNSNGWPSIIIGVSLMISEIVRMRRDNKLKRKVRKQRK